MASNGNEWSASVFTGGDGLRRSPHAVLPMRPDREGRRQRRRRVVYERLLQAAETLVSTHGIVKTTVQQITDLADVGKGTFFNYFPTKEHLLAAFVEQHTREFERMLARPRAGETPVEDLVAEHVHGWPWLWAEPDNGREWLTPYESFVTALVRKPSVRLEVGRQILRRREHVARLIAEGQDRGECRSELAAMEVATVIDIAAYGIAHTAWARQAAPDGGERDTLIAGVRHLLGARRTAGRRRPSPARTQGLHGMTAEPLPTSAGPRRVSVAREDRRREAYLRLLHGAETLLLAGPIEETTPRQITDVAGVDEAAFFEFFPTRDHVLVALAHREVRRLKVLTDRVRRDGRSAIDLLVEYLRAWWPETPNRETWVASYESIMATLVRKRSIRREIGKQLMRQRTAFSLLIAEGQARGECRADVDAVGLATLVMSMACGAMHTAWVLRAPPSPADREIVVAGVLDVLGASGRR